MNAEPLDLVDMVVMAPCVNLPDEEEVNTLKFLEVLLFTITVCPVLGAGSLKHNEPVILELPSSMLLIAYCSNPMGLLGASK